MTDAPRPETSAHEGGVTISDAVVAKIAHQAILGIEGVYGLGSSSLGVLSRLRGDEGSQGVSVDLRDDSVDVDANVVVRYGANIPEVGQRCRAAVKEQVEASTALSVRAVNVLVTDIHFPEDTADAST